jgi:DHA2 family multidrug resistance protein
MGAVLVGTFMVSLDQTMVTIALARIGLELGSVQGVDWVMSAYLLALGLVQPTTGWLADRFGRKRVFLGSLALFSTGSLLAGLAPDLPQLVAARVLQGLGGGAIFPVGMAMVYEQVSPSRRGTAMGVWSLGIALAPALGPTIGGLIVTELGWRWLFFVNVPIGIAGVIVGARVLKFAGFTEHRRFDTVGFGLVTTGLAAVLIAVSEGRSGDLASLTVVPLGVVGAILLTAFVWHDLRQEDPLIDVRMFRIPEFSVAMVLVAGMISVNLARLVFVPLQLVTLRGLSELEVGLLLTPAAFAQAVASPIAGALTDRIGARVPVILGLATMAVSSFLLANLELTTPLVAVGAVVALQGAGTGLALTPNQVAGMNALPQRLLARGTAIRSTTRQVAGSFSIALLSAFLVARLGDLGPPTDAAAAAAAQQAYDAVFVICTIAMLGCLALAIAFVPRADRMQANAAARDVEHAELVARQ